MSFEKALMECMRAPTYVPLAYEQLVEVLAIPTADVRRFRKFFFSRVEDGTIVKVKGNRFCLPVDADLITGIIRFRQSGSAFLITDPTTKNSANANIQIMAEDTAVAMHGDKVVVRLVRERRPRHGPYRAKKAGDPDPVLGRVIRILQRANETITGTLQKARLFHYVVPDDPRIIQDVLVPDPSESSLFPKPKVEDKVIVKLHEWKQRHLNPEGEIIEILGATHSPGAEFKAILHKFKLDPTFPGAVLEEVEALPTEVRSREIKGRLDCRDLFTFTIDPDDAKDFDDALSLGKDANGDLEIGIHIADVSAYVKTGSPLDKEARERGNSTYLVGTVISMLPHALSNGLCSLVEGEDRLVKSVFITFTPQGKIKATRLANSVIRSNKRLTYRQAYAMMQHSDLETIRATPLPPAHQTGSTGRALAELNDKELTQLRDAVRTLWNIASQLRERRMIKGSLDLDMTEVKIFVDEQGYADRIEKITNDESHQLIEEFMLAANETIARTLHEAGLPFLSRVHDKPEADKLNELRDTLATQGVATGDLTLRKEVTKLLALLKDHPQGYTLKIQFLRSMKQACYRASVDGHYGLHKTYYGHYTSPIRRYADLVNHRIVDYFMSRNKLPTAPSRPPQPYKQGDLDGLGQHLSLTEQNSTEAERESVKIKLLEYFEREANRVDKTAFAAIITDVRNHGMFIELCDSMAYGLVHISTFRDDLYRLSSDGSEIIGRKKQKRFGMGQRVMVTVERVDRFKRQIDFKVVEDDSEPAPKSPARQRQKPTATPAAAKDEKSGKKRRSRSRRKRRRD